MSVSIPSSNSHTVAVSTDLDSLTGALTRQAFILRLVDRAALANTSGQTFGLCLADADQLKTINERHGQQTGDEILAQLTRRIRLEAAVLLPDDHEIDLCRYDGNGFAILLPDVDLDQASRVAENCRRAIGASEIRAGVRLTISVGVAQYRLWESAEDTLSRAEQALHLAKQSGRDRVEVAPSPRSCAERAPVLSINRSA